MFKNFFFPDYVVISAASCGNVETSVDRIWHLSELKVTVTWISVVIVEVVRNSQF